MPILFLCILILVLWIRYQINKSRNVGESASETFWERESRANHTRNQNIDSLDYIKIPLTELPLIETTDSFLCELQSTLISLASEQILDLSIYTNTELKLTYGIGNYSFLAQCDSNYTALMRTLDQLADFHIKAGNIASAIAFYEYAVACNSENAKTYVSLAQLYAQQDNTSKLDALKLHLKQSDYKRRDSILQKMDQVLLDCLL